MGEQSGGWLNRRPTPEEVIAHAAVHPVRELAEQRMCVGTSQSPDEPRSEYGMWLCNTGGLPFVTALRVHGGDVFRLAPAGLDYDRAHWMPLTERGMPVGWVDPESARRDCAAYAANAIQELKSKLDDAVKGERAADQEVERLRAVETRLNADIAKQRSLVDGLRGIMRQARTMLDMNEEGASAQIPGTCVAETSPR
jgi:hypothetical protein